MTGRPRTAQELIHWLGSGAGARWILGGAVLVLGLALGVLIAWRQFHGAASEPTLAQAELGRQLAAGRGFTTEINYPQAVAFLAGRGVRFDLAAPYPEVYQAPLYPLLIAALPRLLPARTRDWIFANGSLPPPYGTRGDYYLLVLNLLLFAAAIALAADLARRLFGAPAAWLTGLAVFVTLPLWKEVSAVNGTALAMVLALAAFHAWWRAEAAAAVGAATGALVALGALCGALFLCEYSAGALVLVAAAGAARRFPGHRARVLGLLLGSFLVVVAPWVGRNLAVTGLPTGLALQNIALKAGDTHAEPAVFRATLDARLPDIDLHKLGNKVLTQLQETVRTRLWAGGSMWFLAFFGAGGLYVFKLAPVNRLRWHFALSLLVLVAAQATFNPGDSERLAVTFLAPLIIVFGAGFFFVLLASNPVLGSWPRLSASALLALQAAPLVHDALNPRWLHFQYPPYFPQLFQNMRRQLEVVDPSGRFGLMADVPAGVAWYGQTRVWAQPATLRDFYAVQAEQPTGELLLTPKTLDRPFFSDLNAKSSAPAFLTASIPKIGEWGGVYGGLLTGTFPPQFPLSVPRKVTEDLYLLLNGSIAGGR